MIRLAWCLPLALLMAACVTGAEQERMEAIYNKYDSHCREHARELAGEADEDSRYEECMNYYIVTDIECPICARDFHLSKAKK